MRFRQFVRISVLALSAVTAAVAYPVIMQDGQAIAAPNASGLAIQAARAALKGDFIEAGSLAKRSGDEAAIKLVELIYLRDHPNDAGYRRIMAFLDAAPKWPLAESLLKRAERSLYVNSEDPALILAHFAKRQPVTPEGYLALARALEANGDEAGARTQVQHVWLDADIEPTIEQAALKEFGNLLSTDDHKKRMWRLVYAQQSNAAIRAAKRLPGEYQKAAEVAQKLLRGEGGADKKYSSLPASMREALGMKYALTNYYRKKESYSKARAILVTIPGDAAKMGDPQAWWVERRIVARHSIGINSNAEKAAYQISRAHGFARGEGALEGEFLAGWISLRYLKDSETALSHFNKLAKIAESRTEKARAGYWTGRALEAMGQKTDAKAAYKDAAKYSTVYYGQLAREKIGLGTVPEEIESGVPSDAARNMIDQDEAARAFKILAEAGAKNELYMFLWAFANRFNTRDEMNAAADLVWSEGGATMAVRLAKAAATRNIDIDSWGYPVRALPDWKQIGRTVEKPLVFALSRQESEFNPTAGSKVGAQGLMQIMPGTARLIAKKYGLSYANGQLTSDPAYNVKLGAAHLGDLVADFGGSYVLTLVAYNAGPRRSREWVAEYGDLRSGQVDPVDWVESIPFQETRQYVQKVLQNLHIYRSRLAPKTVRPMTADLGRGSTTDALSVASTSTPEPAADDAQRCAKSSIADILASCN